MKSDSSVAAPSVAARSTKPRFSRIFNEERESLGATLLHAGPVEQEPSFLERVLNVVEVGGTVENHEAPTFARSYVGDESVERLLYHHGSIHLPLRPA